MSPYLYSIVAGKNILTVFAIWNLEHSVNSAPYVRGTGPGGIDIPETVTEVSGLVVTLPATAATAAFPDQTNFYDPFTIEWEISFDGGNTWQEAGESENPIYVCLVGPGPTPFRTVVHLACSNSGATNTDQAVAKTWDLFSGPANVNAWDESSQSYSRKLYYYRPGTTSAANPFGSTAALLQSPNDSGQCSTWAHLLKDSWALNGASSSYIFAVPTGDFLGQPLTWLMVKHWIFNSSTSPDPGTWRFTLAGFYTPGNTYGDLVDQTGLSGQNSATPSQKPFNNHQFLKYNSTYYDPSYGTTYTDAADFQVKALSGYGYETVIPGTLYITQSSVVVHVQFFVQTNLLHSNFQSIYTDVTR